MKTVEWDQIWPSSEITFELLDVDIPEQWAYDRHNDCLRYYGRVEEQARDPEGHPFSVRHFWSRVHWSLPSEFEIVDRRRAISPGGSSRSEAVTDWDERSFSPSYTPASPYYTPASPSSSPASTDYTQSSPFATPVPSTSTPPSYRLLHPIVMHRSVVESPVMDLTTTVVDLDPEGELGDYVVAEDVEREDDDSIDEEEEEAHLTFFGRVLS